MAKDKDKKEVIEYLATTLGQDIKMLTMFTPLGNKAVEIIIHLQDNFGIKFEEEMPEKVGHIIGALLRPAPD